MQIRVVYFEGCPNHAPTVELVRKIAGELSVSDPVEEIKVETPEEALAERMLGSPTIQVDGKDIDPASRERTDFVFSCRVYNGQNGLPPREMIAAALTGRDYCSCSSDESPPSGGCCK